MLVPLVFGLAFTHTVRGRLSLLSYYLYSSVRAFGSEVEFLFLRVASLHPGLDSLELGLFRFFVFILLIFL
jgi:hypothetical protein